MNKLYLFQDAEFLTEYSNCHSVSIMKHSPVTVSPYQNAVKLSKLFQLNYPLEVKLSGEMYVEGMKFIDGMHVFSIAPDMTVEEMYEHFARAKAGELFGSCFETPRFSDNTHENHRLLFFAFIQIILTAVAYRTMRLFLPETTLQQEIDFMFDYYLTEIRPESQMELWTLALYVMLTDQEKIESGLPQNLLKFKEVACEALKVLDNPLSNRSLIHFFNRFARLHGLQSKLDDKEIRITDCRN